MIISFLKEKRMEGKNRTLEDIADDILGCTRIMLSQVFLTAADSIEIWLILSDNRKKRGGRLTQID